MGIFVHSGNGLSGGCRTVRHSGIVKKGYTLHVHPSVDGGERDTLAVHVQTAGTGSEKFKRFVLHVHRQLLMVLFLLYDIEKLYVNAGMPEKS
jgi:hypothetical protein